MAKHRKGYLFRRGKTYYAAWYIGGKKFVKSTAQTDRKDAEKELARIMEPFLIEDEVKTLQYVKARIEGAKGELAQIKDRDNPPLPISATWATYLTTTNRPDSGPKTLATYELQWGRFVAWLQKTHPAIGNLRDVTFAVASDFVNHLLETKRSPGTVNKYITLLHCIYRVLAARARIEGNPFDGITRRKDLKQGRRELTIDELGCVCRSAEGDLRPLIAIGLYTGLRLSDACTLQWEEVDLLRGIIRRVPSKTARRNPNPVIIPLHPALGGILSELPTSKRKGYILQRIAADYARHPTYVTDRLQRHFKACGIATRRKEPGRMLAVVEVGFHSLRHTFVSLCREADAPLAVVEAIVGHSNPAMTRHYTHVSEFAATQAVAVLPSVFSDAKMLPAPAAAQPIDHAALRVLAEKLGAKTWPQVKAELLALAGMA